MSQEHSKSQKKQRALPKPRSFAMLFAFVFGIPAGLGILALIHYGPLRDTLLLRYTSHPVEMVTVVLFGCALGALLTKSLRLGKELAAFRVDWLPSWSGQTTPVEQAEPLLAQARQNGGLLQNTYLGRRIANGLDFVKNRHSAQDLDDHLRGLTDNDEVALDGSYSLIRFITWAIPILGFLGTVLGITGAIAGVNPEVLEKGLSKVTDGLAVAFDTTAVALALTMVVMFLSFVMERLEQNLLERVNRFADEQLAHRFERVGAESSEFVEALRKNTDVLLKSTEKLVQQQVHIWQQTVSEAQRQWSQLGGQQQQLLVHGMEEVLERTAKTHAQRLKQHEQQTMRTTEGALGQLGELLQAMSAQTTMLSRLNDNSTQLVQLQQVLEQNLNVLAGAGTFEQAVNSLTAAIHLLTAKTTTTTTVHGPHKRMGAAA